MDKILTWQEVIDYLQTHKKINKNWVIKTKLTLKEKFDVINGLNDYISFIINNVDDVSTIDFTDFEIYSRLLAMGAYYNMIPLVCDCKTEYYDFLEENNFLQEVISPINYEDYAEFMSLIRRYINIDGLLCVRGINDIIQNIEEIFTTKNFSQELVDTLGENENVINKMAQILNFNDAQEYQAVQETIEKLK